MWRSITGVTIAGLIVGGAGPALADNTVTLRARGCPSCTVKLYSLEDGGYYDEVRLTRGRAAVRVPNSINALQFGVTTKSGVSGPYSETQIVAMYKGFVVDDLVSNAQSRRSKWGITCMEIGGDVDLSFRVVRDYLPRDVVRRDPTITRRVYLRAWASPTAVPWDMDYQEALKGFIGSQNTTCGEVNSL